VTSAEAAGYQTLKNDKTAENDKRSRRRKSKSNVEFPASIESE